MRKLIELQQLDNTISELKQRELEIPRQKETLGIQRKRLEAELKESEERVKRLRSEQKDCEGDTDLKNTQIAKYETQLLSVKKNEEYKALLHEIDLLKKQIGLKDERIIAIMMEIDEAQLKFAEDKKRIQAEISKLDEECARIDAELAQAMANRKDHEGRRQPLAASVAPALLSRYERVRKVKTPAVVPLRDEQSCGGCFMTVRAQVVNEIMAHREYQTCQQCGRLLYYPGNIDAID